MLHISNICSVTPTIKSFSDKSHNSTNDCAIGRIMKIPRKEMTDYVVEWCHKDINKLKEEYGFDDNNVRVRYHKQEQGLLTAGRQLFDATFKSNETKQTKDDNPPKIPPSNPIALTNLVTLQMNPVEESDPVHHSDCNSVMSSSSSIESFNNYKDEIESEEVTDEFCDEFSNDDSAILDNAVIDNDISTEELPSDLRKNLSFNFQQLRDCDNIDDILLHELRDERGTSKPDGCLKKGISDTFSSISECVSKVGGLDINLIKRITFNSNAHARNKLKHGNFAGYKWSDITATEMIRFFGIMLKISILDLNMGGYDAYWKKDLTVQVAPKYSVKIEGHDAWARRVMTKPRFKQIRAAFRPEIGSDRVGDKCHQIRYVLNKFNFHANKTFTPGFRMSFDEGGHPCRSRYCPVRQYNKDKPNKFRVDFFILCDSKKYFISHLDVYQGKNGTDIHEVEQVRGMASTQKAVANAIITANLSNDPCGYREVYCDNRYASPELAVYLRENCRILMSGTMRSNRKGFEKKMMDMSKTNSLRGDSKFYYDVNNQVSIVQWHDNKIVNVVSTLGSHGKVDIQRRVGSKMKIFTTEKCIKAYQENMGGVDRGDQIRDMGAGFCRKAHFKKWYKKTFFPFLILCY